jgi:VanZ family protein
MLPLRYRRLWLAAGWILAVGVCVGSLIPGEVLASVPIYDKLLHAGAYFVLMTWFAGVYEARHQVPLALVLMAAGLGLDLLQGLTASRTTSLLDVLANCVGVAVGLVLAWIGLAGWCQHVERRWFA